MPQKEPDVIERTKTGFQLIQNPVRIGNYMFGQPNGGSSATPIEHIIRPVQHGSPVPVHRRPPEEEEKVYYYIRDGIMVENKVKESKIGGDVNNIKFEYTYRGGRSTSPETAFRNTIQLKNWDGAIINKGEEGIDCINGYSPLIFKDYIFFAWGKTPEGVYRPDTILFSKLSKDRTYTKHIKVAISARDYNKIGQVFPIMIYKKDGEYNLITYEQEREDILFYTKVGYETSFVHSSYLITANRPEGGGVPNVSPPKRFLHRGETDWILGITNPVGNIEYNIISAGISLGNYFTVADNIYVHAAGSEVAVFRCGGVNGFIGASDGTWGYCVAAGTPLYGPWGQKFEYIRFSYNGEIYYVDPSFLVIPLLQLNEYYVYFIFEDPPYQPVKYLQWFLPLPETAYALTYNNPPSMYIEQIKAVKDYNYTETVKLYTATNLTGQWVLKDSWDVPIKSNYENVSHSLNSAYTGNGLLDPGVHISLKDEAGQWDPLPGYIPINYYKTIQKINDRANPEYIYLVQKFANLILSLPQKNIFLSFVPSIGSLPAKQGGTYPDHIIGSEISPYFLNDVLQQVYTPPINLEHITSILVESTKGGIILWWDKNVWSMFFVKLLGSGEIKKTKIKELCVQIRGEENSMGCYNY